MKTPRLFGDIWREAANMETPAKRPVNLLLGGRREAITASRCMPAPIGCGAEVLAFRDEVSCREYRISGLCQKCQDSVFGMSEKSESSYD